MNYLLILITFYLENNHYNNNIGRFLYVWLNIKTIGVKMLGAIIGDLVGSRFEFNNFKLKDFDFFDDDCFYTDDTVMTLAIAKAILSASDDFSNLDKLAIKYIQKYGRKYAIWEYGVMFSEWLEEKNPKPYTSFGNGAAMRISPVGWVANTRIVPFGRAWISSRSNLNITSPPESLVQWLEPPTEEDKTIK